MTLEQFAKEVAKHLVGWEFEKMIHSNSALLTKDEMGIYLRGGTYDFDVERSRVEISGKYPRGPDGYIYLHFEAEPRPTAAARRGPEAVAKDIKRKFLTPYLELYRKGQEAIKRHQEQERQQQDMIKELAQILGVEAGHERLYLDYGGHGYVQVGTGGYVEFHLRSVPHDLAMSIAKLIRKEKDSD